MSESALARLNTDLDAETQLKQGVVVDVRGNTGGFVNGFAIDIFARRNYLTMHPRGLPAAPSRVLLGQRALLAPTILLTNRSTYSDGEDFMEGYRALHLGKTVGEPTGGSVIFTSIVSLLDGTRLGLPTTAVFDSRNQTLERHPRPVDIAVDRPVGEWYTGQDAQLAAAVAELLKELDERHPTPPATTRSTSATTRPATDF
jgi:C-terminal processing protease CtpA/Prc